MAKDKTYKNVGVYAQSLDGGAVLDLGETTDLDPAGEAANKHSIDAGLIADVATLSPVEENDSSAEEPQHKPK